MTIFYIPDPTQYLHLTTTLLTIKKLQIMLRQKGLTSPSFCLHKPRTFLWINCKLAFRTASIQSTTDG